jgi:hypothetical protein
MYGATNSLVRAAPANIAAHGIVNVRIARLRLLC